MARVFEGRGAKVFDGNMAAKLGTEKNPVVVTVPTKKRSKEVASVCAENGWHVSITLESDKPEDTAELERLLNPPQPTVAETKVERNAPCPCGSGKKYKKCCGR